MAVLGRVLNDAGNGSTKTTDCMLRAVGMFVKNEGLYANCCCTNHHGLIANDMGSDTEDNGIVSGERFFE